MIKIFLYIGWGLAIAVELYFLFNDVSVFQSPNATSYFGSPQSKVAQLEAYDRDVRFQNANDLVWDGVYQAQSFYAKQSLLTMSASKANIKFIDGTVLELDENTLIQFEEMSSKSSNDSEYVLQLLRGGVRVRDSLSRILIQTENTKFSAKANSSLTLKYEKNRESKLTIHSGGVDVQTHRESKSLSAGDEAIVYTDQQSLKIKKNKLKVNLISPVGGEKVGFGSRGKVRFSVSKNNDQSKSSLIFLVSPRKRFSRPVYQFDSNQSNHFFIEDVTSPKKFYWKVLNREGREVSDVETFTLVPALKPVVLYPVKEVKFKLEEKIHLAWDQLSNVDYYEIQISDRFSGKIVLDQESRSQVLRVSRLDPGRYQWKIRGKFKNGDWTRWSDEAGFRVLKAPLEPPKLFNPKFKDAKNANSSFWTQALKIFKEVFFISSAHAEDLAKKIWNVELEWSEVEGAKTYRVQVARTRSFQRIVGQADVESTKWNWPYRLGMENSKGRVFYRVAVFDELNRLGPYSAPKPIYIPQEILALKEPKKAIAPKKQFESKSQWHASLDTGLRGFIQNTETSSLETVRSEKLFFENRLSFGLSTQYEFSAWRNQLSFHFAKFTKPSSTRTTSQPDESVWEVDWISEYVPYEEKIAGFFYGFGGILAYRYRFEKSGTQSVSPSYGISGGPHFSVVRKYTLSDSWLQPMGFGASVSAPLSGLLTKHFYGVETSVWGEWNLKTLGRKTIQGNVSHYSARDWLGLRSELRFRHHLWNSPEGTSVSSWSFWLALQVHFQDPV